MRLRANEVARFIDPFLAAGEKGLPNPDSFDLVIG